MNQTAEQLVITEADIRRAARRCASQTGLDPDDLLQEFHVLLLERREQFAEANRSYILKRFEWTALNLSARANVRACQPLTLAGDDGEPEEMDVVDARALTPEQIVMERQTQADDRRRLERALMSLTGRQERIARELMGGFRKSEIAERLGVSRQIISLEIGKIRAALGCAHPSQQLALFGGL